MYLRMTNNARLNSTSMGMTQSHGTLSSSSNSSHLCHIYQTNWFTEVVEYIFFIANTITTDNDNDFFFKLIYVYKLIIISHSFLNVIFAWLRRKTSSAMARNFLQTLAIQHKVSTFNKMNTFHKQRLFEFSIESILIILIIYYFANSGMCL